MGNAIKRIEEEKIIAIVRGVVKEKLIPLAQALFNGGIRIIECTYDASGRISDEETASNIEMLVNHFGSEMVVGAGTVLTPSQVELTKDVKAPLSNVKFLAVGGVDENNMKDYFDAGACGIGIASGIVKKRMIDDNDFDGITALAKLYTSKL